MRFGILVLNLNGSRWLPDLFDDLRADGYIDKKVYLVDNGSTDGSQALTRDRYPEVTVLQMPRNMGFSMAYNVAVEAAFTEGCDWVVWQNTDTRVLPRWLDRMAAAAASDARIGVMGPVFRDWSSDAPSHFMRARHPDLVSSMEDASRAPVDTDWVEGSACAVRRECFESIGPLEPDLFMYWEETDFCRRARYQGWRVVIVPGSVARHFGGGTSALGNILAVNLNARKTRNYYVYTLCDPHRSIARNALAAGHLFLVHIKAACATSTPLVAIWQDIKAFVWFLGGVPWWYAKWSRDRRCGRPARFSAGHCVSVADLLQGNSSCRHTV